ncbi:MAG: DUF4382 domain-containing protein [Thermodesulfobacteriota bacterium]
MRKITYLLLASIIALPLLLAGCGGGGGSATPSGTVTLALTDAPGSEYDNVFITVRSVWFHLLDTAPYDNLATSGWVRVNLPTPKTIDLLELRGGNISQDLLNEALPAGVYRQILLFLTPTEDPLAPSAAALGLTYNNEVVAGGTAFPLRVPNAAQGIKLAGTFSVEEGKALRLVIDFNVGDDVVSFRRAGSTEYLLKPRLQYFDLASVGAIRGTIDAPSAADNAAFFVVKAETLNGTDNSYYVIRRATFIDNTGNFVLYPVRVPPGSTSTTCDVVLRGHGYNTVIVKNVPVARDTRPNGTGVFAPTVMPQIDMQPRKAAVADYNPSISVSPTGAWAQFHQTLPGAGEKPYVVRFRHVNPLTGRIDAFPLSSEDLWRGNYDAASIALTQVTPVEGAGGFRVAADALQHERSAYQAISPAGPAADFTLAVSDPPGGRIVAGNLIVPISGLDNGIVFIGHGGIIVDAKPLSAAQTALGINAYPSFTVPGGVFGLYGLEALAWRNGGTAFAVGIPRLVDVRASDDFVDIPMIGIVP